MNYSLYLFGTNKGIYIQYPSDGEESFLQPLCGSVKDAQLTIYRKDALTHYAYFRQLSSDTSQVFGICIVTNGVNIKDIKALYQSFDKIFSRVVFSGKILRLTGTGKISYVTDNFASDKISVEQSEISIREIIANDIEPHSTHTRQNFSGLIATKTMAIEERNSELLKAIEQNNTVHIYSNDASNSSINYVEQTISNLYKENSQLRDDYSKLESQKKQYRKVILLFLAVLACAVGLFFMNGSLNDTKNELSRARTEINELNDKLNATTNDLNSTKASLKTTSEERDEVKKQLSELKDKVSSTMPIIISDIEISNTYSDGSIETDYGNTIYSSSTRYLKPRITYTGIKTSENITLNVKFYTPSGLSTGSSSPYGCSYSYSMYVYSGENKETLSGWGGSSAGHWSRGSYRFEIWYDNVCLKSKSFTIY